MVVGKYTIFGKVRNYVFKIILNFLNKAHYIMKDTGCSIVLHMWHGKIFIKYTYLQYIRKQSEGHISKLRVVTYLV